MTGVRLPVTVLFDHPTVEQLTKVVDELLEEAETKADTGTEAGQGGAVLSGAAARNVPVPAAEAAVPVPAASSPLMSLFRSACASGRISEGLRLLGAAAHLREEAASPAAPRPPIRFARGAGQAALVCLPSFVAPASPYQFARFASVFRGERDVYALTAAGYADGEPLPESVGALVRAQADAVRACVDGRPFVLVGYSSGGWLAQAVAEELAEGDRPAGLVLLDSYLPDDPEILRIQSTLFDELATKPEVADLVDDANLTAMGRHLDLFRGWTPRRAAAPTLMVRAEELPGGEDGARSRWPLAHAEVSVPGSHVSMIDEFAGTTARAVASWLRPSR